MLLRISPSTCQIFCFINSMQKLVINKAEYIGPFYIIHGNNRCYIRKQIRQNNCPPINYPLVIKNDNTVHICTHRISFRKTSTRAPPLSLPSKSPASPRNKHSSTGVSGKMEQKAQIPRDVAARVIALLQRQMPGVPANRYPLTRPVFPGISPLSRCILICSQSIRAQRGPHPSANIISSVRP